MNIQNITTGKIEEWTINEMLEEINRDRSDRWIPYTEEDMVEGWDEWVEGDYYSRFPSKH